MPKMIEVIIESVRVSLTNQHRIVVMRERDGDRHLPIWIGAFEAESITLALQEIEVARPQTHDLLKNTINTLNGRLVRIEIVSLRDDVFYGNLIIEVNGETVHVDSRPSDAIALAIRCHVPVLISSEILDMAGFVPEEEVEDTDEEVSEENDGEQIEVNDDRLSVFEDFLESLDKGESDDESDTPADDDEPDPGEA